MVNAKNSLSRWLARDLDVRHILETLDAAVHRRILLEIQPARDGDACGTSSYARKSVTGPNRSGGGAFPFCPVTGHDPPYDLRESVQRRELPPAPLRRHHQAAGHLKGGLPSFPSGHEQWRTRSRRGLLSRYASSRARRAPPVFRRKSSARTTVGSRREGARRRAPRGSGPPGARRVPPPRRWPARSPPVRGPIRYGGRCPHATYASGLTRMAPDASGRSRSASVRTVLSLSVLAMSVCLSGFSATLRRARPTKRVPKNDASETYELTTSIPHEGLRGLHARLRVMPESR